MNEASIEDMLDFSIETAFEMGKYQCERFGKVTTLEIKEFNGKGLKPATRGVTPVDFKSQEIFLRALRKKFPSHAVIAEEETTLYKKMRGIKSDYVWIVDPLDGTKNYAFRDHHFGISIASMYRKELVVAVCHFPKLNETYVAKKDAPTVRNGDIVVPPANDDFSTKDTVFVSEGGGNTLKELVRAIGFAPESEPSSAVYKMLAITNLKGRCCIGRDCKPWDVAGSTFILRQAGYYVGFDIDFAKSNIPFVIAAPSENYARNMMVLLKDRGFKID